MVIRCFSLILLLLITSFIQPKPENLSAEEQKLVKAINQYRKSIGLKEIAYSPSLTLVAQMHAADLRDYPPKEGCNMHSWSEHGKWIPCCYTADHKQAGCMWLKPKEVAGYEGHGYEISAMNTAPDTDWLAQWKKSQAHHQVMINQGIWKQVEWNAMGLAIRRPYAVVWFGKEADLAAGK